MIREVEIDGVPLLQLPLEAPLAAANADDPKNSEWVVRVDWKRTFPHDQAQTFKGVFANQNIVCKLRDPTTVDFLRRQFGVPAGV